MKLVSEVISLLVAIIILPFSISFLAFSVPASTENYWTIGTPMPTARSEIAGAVLNDKIYIVGGFDNTGRSTSNVEVYNPVTGKWMQSTSLPQSLDHAAATSFNGKLYVVGGGYLNRDTLSDKLYILDSRTNNWTEGASLPTPRGALTANFIKGMLYVTGGVDSENTLATTLAYNPSLDQWTEKAPMPTAREHLTSAVIDNKLYVIGGRTNGMAFNVDADEVYDPVTDNWTKLDPMPSKRGGLSATTIASNESIYVFGGEQPSGTLTIMKSLMWYLVSGPLRLVCQQHVMDWRQLRLAK